MYVKVCILWVTEGFKLNLNFYLIITLHLATITAWLNNSIYLVDI